MKWLAFGCIHAPITHEGYWDWLLKQINDFQPDIIVNLGDWFEGKAAKRWPEHPSETWDLTHEFKQVARQAAEINEIAPLSSKYWVYGNHDCFDDQTEVLTESGWKLFVDLNSLDKVAQYDIETKEIDYDFPTCRIHRPYDGDMLSCGTKVFDFCVTPTHNMIARAFIGQSSLRPAETLLPKRGGPGSQWVLPVAGHIAPSSYPNIQDVKLAAWLLTDCCYGPRITFYQRESNAKHVRDILDGAGLTYRESSRQRDITHICGKLLKKKSEHEVSFMLDAESTGRARMVVPMKAFIPQWVNTLPQNLFRVFLEEIIEADGTPNLRGEGAVVYKSKAFLDQLQIACILHGYRAILNEYRPGHWKLKVVPSDEANILKAGRNIKRVPYRGNVHCVTMPKGTVVVRRNGYPLIAGNCNVFNEPHRLHKDVQPLVRDWQTLNPYGIADALKDWKVTAKYGHDIKLRLGPLTFQHGCQTGKGIPQSHLKDQTYAYARPFGLHVSAHTHEPVPVTQCRERSCWLPYWYANVGTGADWDRMHYMDRLSKQAWGRGCVLGEVNPDTVKHRRAAFSSREWDAETRVHSYFAESRCTKKMTMS